MNRASRRLATPHLGRRTYDGPGISGPGLGLNGHRRVVEVAVAMANELFESYAINDEWYRKMRAEGRVTEKEARAVFVDRVAPRLLEDARRALADVLNQPNVPTAMKDEIAEALILDTQLRAKRFVAADEAVVPSRFH